MTEAAEPLPAALDHDGLPIRCPAPLRAAYARVARRHPRSILIDGRRELAAVSPPGLLDDHVIQDTHHPTLRGYVALAGAVLRELARERSSDHPIRSAEPLDPAVCARISGWTPSDGRRCASGRASITGVWPDIGTIRTERLEKVAPVTPRQPGRSGAVLSPRRRGLAGISLEPLRPGPEWSRSCQRAVGPCKCDTPGEQERRG